MNRLAQCGPLAPSLPTLNEDLFPNKTPVYHSQPTSPTGQTSRQETFDRVDTTEVDFQDTERKTKNQIDAAFESATGDDVEKRNAYQNSDNLGEAKIGTENYISNRIEEQQESHELRQSSCESRVMLLGAALLADSIASTAPVFRVATGDQDHESSSSLASTMQANQQLVLREFDEMLIAVMPTTPIEKVALLRSLPKLSLSLGKNTINYNPNLNSETRKSQTPPYMMTAQHEAGMWMPKDFIVDRDSYLGNMSAIHNTYVIAEDLEKCIEKLDGTLPDRDESKQILNKLTLLYVRISKIT